MTERDNKRLLDPAYRRGIVFIAYNDDNGANDALDVNVVRAYVSTILMSEVFQLSNVTVAKDVVNLRRAATLNGSRK